MYGTNQDFHASHAISAPAFLSIGLQPVLEHSAKETGGSAPATLGEFFHRAWTSLTGRH